MNAFSLDLKSQKLFMKLKFICFLETDIFQCIRRKLPWWILRKRILSHLTSHLINMAFQRNVNEPTNFLVSRSPYKEIQKYLNEKSYSPEIGVIIINIPAKVISTSAYIYVGGEGNEYIQSNLAESRSCAINGGMHLFKRSEHYEPIVNRNFERKVIDKNKRISRRTMVAMIQTVQQSNITKNGFYSNNTFTVATLLVKISSAKTVVTWVILTVKIFLRIFFRRLKLSSFS